MAIKRSVINEEFGRTKASYKYKDNGCKLALSCLECPFEYRRYDTRKTRNSLRDKNIISLYKESMGTISNDKSIKNLSKKFNLSERTIYRIINAKGIKEAAIENNR